MLSKQAERALQTEAWREAKRRLATLKPDWPQYHLANEEGEPVAFHYAQTVTFDLIYRFIAMLAGTQGGKTGFGPFWLNREIETRGAGDYLAVTSTYDLFKLKMLPAMLACFVDILGIGKYWAGSRVIEIRNPKTLGFEARRQDDPMYARIILRSADSIGGLESATAKAAWLDECGQSGFLISAWKAIRRRLSIHRGRALLTTTLYDSNWLDDLIIEKAKVGGETILETIGEGEVEITTNEHSNIGLVQFDSIINPVFPIEEYREAESELPEDEFESFYRGRRVTSKLMVYGCYSKERNTCPRFNIPPNDGTRFLMLDFGPVNTVALYAWKEPNTGNLYIYREYHAGGKEARQHAKDILDGEVGRPTCYGGSKSESNWRLEFRAGGLPVREPKYPDVGLQITTTYANIKKRKVIFFDDLKGTLSDLKRYRYRRDRFGNVTEDIEQEKQRHYMAALRYGVSSVMRLPSKFVVEALV